MQESNRKPDKFNDISYNPSIPRVTSISGYGLQKNGWAKTTAFEWQKSDNVIVYDGAKWEFNGKQVHHMEDLE